MVQITPKGVVLSAQMLFDRGYLAERHRNKLIWLYQSGVGWENKEFRKHWTFVQDAARKALESENNAAD